jgi:hypothetical protein
MYTKVSQAPTDKREEVRLVYIASWVTTSREMHMGEE